MPDIREMMRLHQPPARMVHSRFTSPCQTSTCNGSGAAVITTGCDQMSSGGSCLRLRRSVRVLFSLWLGRLSIACTSAGVPPGRRRSGERNCPVAHYAGKKLLLRGGRPHPGHGQHASFPLLPRLNTCTHESCGDLARPVRFHGKRRGKSRARLVSPEISDPPHLIGRRTGQPPVPGSRPA